MAQWVITYGEKTCWVTSEEGFEFSAPIVVMLTRCGLAAAAR